MANEARFREAEQAMWASVGVTPTESRVRLESTGLTLRIQEAGQGTPVVFLHGASNSGTSWADLVARLDGFRCLMVDRPGSGLSEPFPRPFEDLATFEAANDAFVPELLDALELERAHVVATSAGGYPTLRTAALKPERLDRVVLFGWTLGAPTSAMPLVMRLATVPWIGRLMTKMPASEGAVRAMFKQIGLREALEAGRVSQEAIDSYRALLNHTDTMRNELQAGPRMITLKGMDEQIYLPDDLLARIQTPIYFLWGTEDPFGDADVARTFTAKIPTAELELLPEAGHAVWLDDPDKAAAVTTDFLRG